MKEVIKNNKLLVFLLSIYGATGIFILAYFSKGEFELIINRNHSPYLDDFFFYITYLGDGVGSAIIVILLFFRRIYYGILAAISLIISSIWVQFMKRAFFADFPRPKKFFADKIKLHLIDGLEMHTIYSFPSGHSSGAFSVFIILCLVSKDKRWSVLYFGLAVVTAISRVYLMQHFFIDTFFGAIIGTICAVIVYFYIQYKSNIPQKEILQLPLLKIFDK